jgi:hypothetical protein
MKDVLKENGNAEDDDTVREDRSVALY